ncbi:MAG: SRPBCC family protein [Solirubrobacteraceae bacterium]
MSRVVARASAQVPAAPERVVEFLRDYRDSRERILTDNYTAYRVEQGGKGEGTVFAYHFAAGGRERDYRLHVRDSPGGLQESDQLSTFVTTWTVDPSPTGSEVTIESSWDGAGGVGGMFERLFAPLGLRRIYGRMLAQLAATVRP